MSHRKHSDQSQPLRIGIIGAGFSGTALLAALHKLNHRPVEVLLFEKTGTFGAGHAYLTPFPFHLLNARARDMSAFEDTPSHFSDWLAKHEEASHYLDKSAPPEEQFVPRMLYRLYLQHILDTICHDPLSKIKVTLVADEVIDITRVDNKAVLSTQNGQRIHVDKVVLAVGVTPPSDFPFSISSDSKQIINPWDYVAVKQIPPEDSVLIVGTGLSMIDVVLTLHHQQHKGKLTAVSRHGLVPLPHAEHHVAGSYEHTALPGELRTLTRHLRTVSKDYMEEGGDWRTLINALRHKMPTLWQAAKLKDKQRFLRHVLPYWNVHRHRVINKVVDLLSVMRTSGSLSIYSGRVTEVSDMAAKIRLRRSHDLIAVDAKWVVNCMGFSLQGAVSQQPLVASLLQQGLATLDPLRLGFDVAATGALKEQSTGYSTMLFTLGPPAQGEAWETVAVPEIRKQSIRLAARLLGVNE